MQTFTTASPLSYAHGHPDFPAMVVPPDWTGKLPIDELFDDTRPLVVDVGCGKGRFLAARAAKDATHNYLGVERQLVRVRKVSKKITRQQLGNARVIRVEASYAIRYMLPEHAVAVMVIFFSDPWPKKRHHKRRLFNAEFLDTLDRVLAPGGEVHIATDHMPYFAAIGDLFREDRRYDPCDILKPGDDERTEFETLFMGKNMDIGRCSYRRSASD